MLIIKIIFYCSIARFGCGRYAMPATNILTVAFRPGPSRARADFKAHESGACGQTAARRQTQQPDERPRQCSPSVLLPKNWII